MTISQKTRCKTELQQWERKKEITYHRFYQSEKLLLLQRNSTLQRKGNTPTEFFVQSYGHGRFFLTGSYFNRISADQNVCPRMEQHPESVAQDRAVLLQRTTY